MTLSVTRRIGFLFFLVLVGCPWNEPPPRDTIVFGLGSEPKSLDPRYATDANGQRLLKLVFSSLVRIGPELEIVGDVASHWVYKDGAYVFTLKPNIFFHNGDPLTFSDIEFSIKEYQKPSSPFSAQFKIIERVSGHYDVQKGGLIKLKLSYFSSSLINDLPSLSLLPKKEVKKMQDLFYQNPIGSGPFIFEKSDIKNIHLQRNERFYGQKSVTEKVHFKIIKDSNTRFQKVYKGRVDIVQSDIPFSKVKIFEQSEKFNVSIQPGLSTQYILLNLRSPILKQKKVRQAISAAISREELIRYTLEGFAEPAKSILTTANPFHFSELQSVKLSEREIKNIFKNLKEHQLVLKTSNGQEAVENGRILTHQLSVLGLNVIQKSYEWGTYYEDVRTGKFDMAVMKWVGIFDPDIYRISLHSKMTPPGRNRGYYNNKKFDLLVEKASREPNPKLRRQFYNQAQRLVFAELPTIPLWYEKQVAINHKRVKNYKLPINGDFTGLLTAYKEDNGAN